ncbi:MAG: pyridoxamine 5'-phosphate oxidase family protein [Gammaproteobacteria bacterium]|nr:pyridoxamine 5'-phosphate oxidase family protein [Gammaproteobacteria bacterium]
MPRAFAFIAFTDSVKAAQERYGSRDANRGFELAEDSRSELSLREAEFIGARDSFYMATVGDAGWPYVQHRGGPRGFLKVLDEHHIGFADFHGNAQYLSVGNLSADERVSLILMDYPNRRRLKLWGRARVVHESEAPELIAQLEVPSYRARVERGIVIRIEAWDWNCPQHITPRFTDTEIEALLRPLQEENADLKAAVQNGVRTAITSLGHGPRSLVVRAVRQLTPRVRAIEFRAEDGGELPAFTAGAHIKLPVVLPDGRAGFRHYSLSSNPARRDVYEIAVLLDEASRGGAGFVHQHYGLGFVARVDAPRNDFPLHDDARPALLIAGGIGITPLKAMALTLKARRTPFSLHYSARHRAELAYADCLADEFGAHFHAYASDEGRRMDVAVLLRSAARDTQVYVCGPERLIAAVCAAAEACRLSREQVHFEHFAPVQHGGDAPVELELRRKGSILQVPAATSLLDAVHAARVDVLSDCRAGNCGTCAVRVLDGEVDHRDTALSERERAAGMMCLCVSRGRGTRLVLDL